MTDIELMIRLWLNPRTRSQALAMADANRTAATVQAAIPAQIKEPRK